VSIAHALGESPEDMLRLAGILPSIPPEVAEEREIIAIVRSLTDPTQRQIVLDMLRGLVKRPPPVTLLGAAGSVPAQTAEDNHGDRPRGTLEQMFQLEQATREQADSLLVAAEAEGRLAEVVEYISRRSEEVLQGMNEPEAESVPEWDR